MSAAWDDSPAAIPTRVRYRVLALACGLSMITYLDRVCFGAAAPAIAGELSLAGVSELKWAFTAFAIAYAAFEIPAGWLGDRLGPRGMLLRIVIWWSACTALTGLVGWRWGSWTFGGLGTLIALRFLFGAGEAGAYPNIARALHNWFPVERWEAAQGLVWMSGRLMGGLTPLIWALLVNGTSYTPALMGWRGAFFTFGAVGLIWALAFAAWFRNRPADHPGVNDAEAKLIGSTWQPNSGHGGVPWSALLANRSLWALCGMYFLINYGWAFNITYLPSYLEARYALPPADVLGAIYKGAPLWVGAAGCLIGGFLVGRLNRRFGSRKLGRRALGVAALGLCSACWWGAQVAPNVHIFCLLAALAGFYIDMTLGATWATCQDLGGRHTAVTAAFMNTVGTLGSALAGWMTGSFVEWSLARRAAALQVAADLLPSAEKHAAALAGYQQAFATYAVIFLIASMLWLLIDPEESVDRAPEPA